jgi:hypothetical protein
MMYPVRRKKATIGAATALALAGSLWLGVSTSAPSFAETPNPSRHVIKIYPDSRTFRTYTWTAMASLNGAGGRNYYNWSESHPGGKDYVRWEFTDGGDDSYIDLKIRARDDWDYVNFTHLSLTDNHCYHITVLLTIAEDETCDFK